jgi:hypothetical protein
MLSQKARAADCISNVLFEGPPKTDRLPLASYSSGSLCAGGLEMTARHGGQPLEQFGADSDDRADQGIRRIDDAKPW